MSARGKKKLALKGARKAWWESPTFTVYGGGRRDPAEKIRVELVLPDGAKVNLGLFLSTIPNGKLRFLVGLRFKEIWDQERHCRRTSTT
jgi:hypothetical protein